LFDNSPLLKTPSLGWLLRVTQASDDVTANIRINAVTRISQARLLATAIHLREDIKGTEQEKLLLRWENVSFRIYGMLGNDARTRVGDYVRLAWQVVNDKLAVKDIKNGIDEIGREFTIEAAISRLRGFNCYDGWENELRYFMFRYEEHLAKQQKMNFSNEQWEKIWMVSASDSIEHIWPKSKATEKSKHRLGNLVLLPPKLNSTLQDDDPRDKVEAYRKTGLLIAGEVAEFIKKVDRWNVKSIEKRENSLLDWAETQWGD
jgi:hypothetical protein